MKLATGIFGMLLALPLSAPLVYAQADTEAKPGMQPDTLQTFYLTNISERGEVQEVVTALRNMLTPSAKIFLVPSQNAVLLSTTPDQLVLARKVLADLDRPRKTYRLTYTINESDAGKRIGSQHFTMVVVSGQRTTLKEGSKVPVATGSFEAGSASAQTQFTYIDIGLNFDATLDESANGVRLRTKAEQSSIAEEKSGVGVADPIVRQTILEGTSILTPGKPLILGSLDVPGSTRHLDVEVLMEVVH
jgi:type II secretory pathway component GspD/PulD (secretin)